MKTIKSRILYLMTVTILIIQTVVIVPAQQNRQLERQKDTNKQDQKRLALIIGNGAYKNTTTLDNPANDATDMAQTLKSLGFEVLSGTNQTKRQMENLIRDFGDKLAKNGGVGLFFYAGHGLQVRGQNYLVPVEAEIPAEDEVEYATVNVNFLLGKMDSAGNDLNIVILDACRNNPFARSWRNFRDIGDGKGLAKVTPPTGTIMLYATQPGNVASDGTGRNGLFTESLLKQINKPNVEFDAMVKNLARDVSDKSGGKQLPWKEGIVLGDFYFGGTTNNTADNSNKTTEPPPSVIIDKDAGEREAWSQIKDSANRSDYALFVESFPNGIYAAQAKQKWEQVWWDAIKNGTNKADFESFLKQFPSGQYA
ncbi:MAG: caspase family protein, partial [Pyrinomonadaceae bacterium]